MSWTSQLGLWLARQGGWQERLETSCSRCPKMDEQIAALQGTIDTQSTQLAQQVAELSARPTQYAVCSTCPDLRHEIAQLTQQVNAFGVETRTYQAMIERLSQETEARKHLLAQQLDRVKVPTDVVLRARELSEGPWPSGQGGESKRHHVYAKLMKEFPNIPKRNLGLSIELALHQVA